MPNIVIRINASEINTEMETMLKELFDPELQIVEIYLEKINISEIKRVIKEGEEKIGKVVGLEIPWQPCAVPILIELINLKSSFVLLRAVTRVPEKPETLHYEEIEGYSFEEDRNNQPFQFSFNILFHCKMLFPESQLQFLEQIAPGINFRGKK